MVLTFSLLLSLVFKVGMWWHYVLASFGALLFSMFILYDTSRIIHAYYYSEYIPAAITLYTDIVNLFVWLLALMGGKR